MIKHIVMFKLKESVPNEKMREVLQLKLMLDMLPKSIREIEAFETGMNFTESDRAFDLVLISEFKSISDLDIYREHPEHKKVVEYIKEVCDTTHVVDYEV